MGLRHFRLRGLEKPSIDGSSPVVERGARVLKGVRGLLFPIHTQPSTVRKHMTANTLVTYITSDQYLIDNDHFTVSFGIRWGACKTPKDKGLYISLNRDGKVNFLTAFVREAKTLCTQMMSSL
jgi:hypothetical protein